MTFAVIPFHRTLWSYGSSFLVGCHTNILRQSPAHNCKKKILSSINANSHALEELENLFVEKNVKNVKIPHLNLKVRVWNASRMQMAKGWG